MRVELFERYIQINIQKRSYLLQRALKFAQRHFEERYQLSNSILILDDGEQLKKEYFLNWAYHMGMQSQSLQGDPPLQTILCYSHLPIRIKAIDHEGMLERVQVSMRFLQYSRVLLCMSKPSKLVRRYLFNYFGDSLVGYGQREIYLDATSQDFWERLLALLAQRVIHNTVLDFDYESFKPSEGIGGSVPENFSYLTREEQLLRQSLKVLSCKIGDDWNTIKNRYLELAKEFHPDNVYGQDFGVVEGYTERFRVIQEAYERVKNNFRRIA